MGYLLAFDFPFFESFSGLAKVDGPKTYKVAFTQLNCWQHLF